MEFLAHVRFTWPESISPEARKSVLDQEVKAVAELARQGHFKRAWRIVGRREMWTLWQARGRQRVSRVGATLVAYMELTAHPLAVHPIDPAPPEG